MAHVGRLAWHTPSKNETLQENPGGQDPWLQHTPSMQYVEAHSDSFVQGDPFGRGVDVGVGSWGAVAVGLAVCAPTGTATANTSNPTDMTRCIISLRPRRSARTPHRASDRCADVTDERCIAESAAAERFGLATLCAWSVARSLGLSGQPGRRSDCSRPCSASPSEKPAVLHRMPTWFEARELQRRGRPRSCAWGRPPRLRLVDNTSAHVITQQLLGVTRASLYRSICAARHKSTV